MGLTKLVKGDGRILFHVGSEIPTEGSNLLLVPGVQKSQGRGVYCSEEPDVRYTGSEYQQKELDVSPVYCIPMTGIWVAGLSKQGNKVYNSKERSILLNSVKLVEVPSESASIPLRYIIPRGVSYYEEPKTRIFDEFYNAVRTGRISTEQALDILSDRSVREEVDPELLWERIKQAIELGKIPSFDLRELETRNELEDPTEEHLIPLNRA